MSALTQCECGYNVKPAGLKTHQRGQVHDSWMSKKRAAARGHTKNTPGANELGRDLRLLFPGEFSVVQNYKAGRPGVKATVEAEWRCSAAMAHARKFFVPMNARADSMHAALVFREVFGDTCGMMVVAAIMHEVTEGMLTYTRQHARPKIEVQPSSMLHVMLRNNGVESPALALVGLAPYALHAAVIQFKEHPGAW